MNKTSLFYNEWRWKEKRERSKKANTDVRDERKKDAEKDQSEKEQLWAHKRMRESTQGSKWGVRQSQSIPWATAAVLTIAWQQQ